MMWVELEVRWWYDDGTGEGEELFDTKAYNVDNIISASKPLHGAPPCTTLALRDGSSIEVRGTYEEVMAKLRGAV